MKGGASSASIFAETIRNSYGWNVMKPSVIGKDFWDRVYERVCERQFEVGYS